MNTPFRVLAALGILIVAASGCGQGKQPGAKGGAVAGKSEEMASSSRGAKAHSKSGSAAHKATAASSGRRAEATSRGHDAGGASATRSGGRVSTLTMADDGGDFTLVKGQVLSVILASSHATGSSWNLVEPTQSVIELDGKPVYVMKSAKAGSAGTETWHFRAARPGHQTVRLEYRRAWARSVPERTFRFTATVR
jgi:predicted secreted protein